jgi:hypothetical protein
LFFGVEQNAIPILEFVGRRLAGVAAIGQPIERRLADSDDAEVGALNLDNEAVVLQLMQPFADSVLAST